MQSLQFQCYVRGRSTDWEAICTDLDISVTGISYDEVRHLLDLSIRAYVETASSQPPDISVKLLRRKSPLATRLAWKAGVIWHTLGTSRHRDGEIESRFDVTCPA